MQPITRATINSFCRVCLQEFDAAANNNEYQLPTSGRSDIFVKTDENLDKLLRFIAADNDGFARQQRSLLPRRLCGECRIKACTFYEFHEKARCTSSVLDEMLQEQLRESMIRNLQKFCRTCLKLLKDNGGDGLSHVDDVEVHDWLKECVDFYVGNGEDNKQRRRDFPKHLCNWCSRKLRNFIEFRRLSKESLEYLDNLLGGLDEDTEQKAMAIIETKVEQAQTNDFKLSALDAAASSHVKSTAPLNSENDCDIFAEQLPVFTANIAKCKLNEKSYELHNFEEDSDFNWDNNDDDDDNTDSNNDKHNVDDGVNANIGINDMDQDNIVAECEENCDDDVPMKVMAQRVLARKKRAKPTPSVDKVNEITINGIDTEVEEKLELKIKGPFCNSSTDEYTPTKTIRRGKRKSKQLIKEKNKSKPANVDEKSKTSHAKKSFVCSKCPKRFYKQILHDAHVRNEHEGIEQPFLCEHCPKSYRAYPFLQQHIKIKHSDKMPDLKCELCSRIFKRKDHLRNHIRGVHEGLRPYKCSYCEKSFAARTTVRVHEMTHTDERPYQCELCPQAYRQPTDLRVHMERHTTSPELLCPICKRAKRSAEELQAHLAEHNQTRHQCPTCGRVFKKRSHLRDHENAVHLGLRPHKCGYCDHTFACRKSMLDHERLHTNERPKVCRYCQQTFRQGSVLRAHIRRQHECEGELVEARKSKAAKVASSLSENLNDLLLFKSTLI